VKNVKLSLAILAMFAMCALAMAAADDAFLGAVMLGFLFFTAGCMVFLHIQQRKTEYADHHIFAYLTRCVFFISMWSFFCLTLLFGGYIPTVKYITAGLAVERFIIIVLGIWILPLVYVFVGMILKINIPHLHPV
jgi:hypothetical protein